MTLLLPLLCLLSPAFGPVSAQDKSPVNVVTVEEGADALLPCAQTSSVEKFDWSKDSGGEEKEEVFFYDNGIYYGNGRSEDYQSQQFRGRVVFLKERLESGNASITIKNTRLEDNGTYTCVLFKPEKREVNIRLNVGAAPLPHIQMLDYGNTWQILGCKSKGVPEPEVQWKNSAGQVLAKHVPKNTDGLSHVELKLNVTRSNTYTCVVTQPNIHHQIDNTMKVRIPDAVDFIAAVEGHDALLPCSLSSEEDIQSIEFSWNKDNQEVFRYNKGKVEIVEQFKGRLTHFQQELNSGNASIKINTHKSDSGRYSCNYENLQTHVVLKITEYSHFWMIIAGSVGIILVVAVAVIVALIYVLKQRDVI